MAVALLALSAWHPASGLVIQVPLFAAFLYALLNSLRLGFRLIPADECAGVVLSDVLIIASESLALFALGILKQWWLPLAILAVYTLYYALARVVFERAQDPHNA